MILTFLIISLIVFGLSVLVVLNFWKYKYKGDRMVLFAVVFFVFLTLVFISTISYLISSSQSSTQNSEEYWANLE